MADISKINLPNGSSYDFKDRSARTDIGSLVDRGAKNLLDFNLASIKSDPSNNGGSSNFSWGGNVCTTPRGVTFTVNSDNTITVNATDVTLEVWFRIKQDYSYKPGTYVMSGCPSGGTASTYFIESDNLNARDAGNSVEIPISTDTTDNVYIVVKSGVTLTNAVFRPMICTKADWDISQRYVPYALPVTTITPELIELVDSGAKNVLNYYSYPNDQVRAWDENLGRLKEINASGAVWDGDTCTIAGVSYQVNGDGTISTSGTATGFSEFVIAYYGSTDRFSGYLLTGCPVGGNFSDRYFLYAADSSDSTLAYDIGNTATIPSTSGVSRLRIGVRSGCNMNGKVFKPMICSKAAWNVSKKFVPFLPSLSDIYSQLKTLMTIQTNGMFLAAQKVSSSSGTLVSLEYTAKMDDFVEIANGNARYTGTYLVHCVNWATDGKVYVGVITYSGGRVTNLTKTDIVTGFTPTISINNATISISGCARISIYSLR